MKPVGVITYEGRPIVLRGLAVASTLPEHGDPRLIASSQPEYIPLPGIQFDTDGGLLLTEWELSAEDLAALVSGGRLRLWVWTFGRPLQPLMLQAVNQLGEAAVEPYPGPERRSIVERRRYFVAPPFRTERRRADRRR